MFCRNVSVTWPAWPQARLSAVFSGAVNLLRCCRPDQRRQPLAIYFLGQPEVSTEIANFLADAVIAVCDACSATVTVPPTADTATPLPPLSPEEDQAWLLDLLSDGLPMSPVVAPVVCVATAPPATTAGDLRTVLNDRRSVTSSQPPTSTVSGSSRTRCRAAQRRHRRQSRQLNSVPARPVADVSVPPVAAPIGPPMPPPFPFGTVPVWPIPRPPMLPFRFPHSVAWPYAH